MEDKIRRGANRRYFDRWFQGALKKTTPEQIHEEISQLGFDADEVKADPEGYKQRDGCCKGQE